MIIVMRTSATQKEIDQVKRVVEEHGLDAFTNVGEERIVIGVVGKDLERLSHLGTLPGVEQVVRISSAYKLASIEHHPQRTCVRAGGVEFGLGSELVVMAGPCAVESREQLFATARWVGREGARVLRGGAFKPRTSPYSFQGLGMPALKLLAEARAETGLPIISEVVDPGDVAAFEEYVDILQIGARNMANFALLKTVGQSRHPVLLKRGPSATIEELLLAAEYILSTGNPNVILCERGIRTFETATRNTLDLSAVPVLRARTHLPIIVDPSHGTGYRPLVGPMALAGAAVGADGLIIEVHPDPANARSDGDQSLSFEEFGALMDELRRMQFIRTSAESKAPSVPVVASGKGEMREQIDQLDTRLVALLQERAVLALAIGQQYQPDHGHDVRRERELLEKAANGDAGPMSPQEITLVFESLVRASRSMQRRYKQSNSETGAS